MIRQSVGICPKVLKLYPYGYLDVIKTLINLLGVNLFQVMIPRHQQ